MRWLAKYSDSLPFFEADRIGDLALHPAWSPPGREK